MFSSFTSRKKRSDVEGEFDATFPPDFSFMLVHNSTRQLDHFNDDDCSGLDQKDKIRESSATKSEKCMPMEQQYQPLVAAFIKLENKLSGLDY